MSILGNNLLAEYYAQNQGLPFGYRAVEYLESTGTQWIDTGVTGSDIINHSISIDADLEGVTTQRTSQLMICYNNGAGSWFGIQSNHSKYGLGDSNDLLEPYNQRLNVNILMDSTGITATSGLSTVTRAIQSGQLSVNSYIKLFSEYTNRLEYASYCKLYSAIFKLGNSNLVIRNYVPCVRVSDNKPGLYELCKSICPLTGNSFYINAGTGEFVTP